MHEHDSKSTGLDEIQARRDEQPKPEEFIEAEFRKEATGFRLAGVAARELIEQPEERMLAILRRTAHLQRANDQLDRYNEWKLTVQA